MLRFVITAMLSVTVLTVSAHEYVTISGRVTDYNGNPVDSCNVALYNPDFTPAYEALSDSCGNYILDSVATGKYACLYAMRVKEYPRMQQVAPEDMKLEFWAWNVVADRDLNLDIRYHKLELYGTTAFLEYGGRQELLIYTRPMSVTKAISYFNYMDKGRAEKESKVTVEPEYMQFEVYADGNPLSIFSVQHLSLPNYSNPMNDDCYLIQTSLPADLRRHNDRPYEIRVVGHNMHDDEWGESVYFLEVPRYRWGQ